MLSRKFIRSFQVFPWRLSRLYDTSFAEAERHVACEAFLKMPSCCLDPGFSRKLQVRCPTTADLLDPKVVSFVRECFQQFPLTTTLLETQFALMRQWLLRTLKPYGMATLAAKHILHVFRTLHEELLQKLKPSGSPKGRKRKWKKKVKHSPLRRPLWAKSGRRLNSQHVYMSEELKRGVGFKEAKRKFADLQQADKEKFAKRARAKNAQSNIIADAMLNVGLDAHEDESVTPSGPWGLGDERFPLSVRSLQADGYGSASFVEKEAQKWTPCGARVLRDSAGLCDRPTLEACILW